MKTLLKKIPIIDTLLSSKPVEEKIDVPKKATPEGRKRRGCSCGKH